MSITQIDVDDDPLAEAMRLMGTTTKKDTVNLALREYATRVKRLEARRRFSQWRRQDARRAREGARPASKHVHVHNTWWTPLRLQVGAGHVHAHNVGPVRCWSRGG